MDTVGGMEGGADGRWLTYAELAEIRRVDKPSAVKLAIRRHWPRRKNNHGTMQVCVPAEWLIPFGAGAPRDTPDTKQRDTTDATPPAVPDQAFQAAIASLTAAREQAEKRADRAEQRADQERLQGDELRSRLDQMTGDLEAAKHDAQTAQDVARKAEGAAEALRLAEEARKGRGRLRRAWDGWRGR